MLNPIGTSANSTYAYGRFPKGLSALPMMMHSVGSVINDIHNISSVIYTKSQLLYTIIQYDLKCQYQNFK